MEVLIDLPIEGYATSSEFKHVYLYFISPVAVYMINRETAKIYRLETNWKTEDDILIFVMYAEMVKFRLNFVRCAKGLVLSFTDAAGDVNFIRFKITAIHDGPACCCKVTLDYLACLELAYQKKNTPTDLELWAAGESGKAPTGIRSSLRHLMIGFCCSRCHLADYVSI